jgi:hypothetical protein
MFRDVHIGVQFEHFKGDQGSAFDAYDEVQRVLDNHFKSRFVDSKGAIYHVQVILCAMPQAKTTPQRVRRVRSN